MIRCIALQKRSCASQAWHARNAFTPQLCIAVTNGHTVWHRWPFGQPAPQPPPLQCVLPNVPSALRRVHAYWYCYWYEGQALPEHPIGSSRGSWAIQAGDVAASGRGAVIIKRDKVATAEAAAQSTACAAHSGSLATAVRSLLNAGLSAAVSWLWQEPLQHGVVAARRGHCGGVAKQCKQAGDVAARRTSAVMFTKGRLAAAEAAAQSTACAASSGSSVTAGQNPTPARGTW